MRSLPITLKVSTALLVLLALGPLIAGVDLALGFMPAKYSAVQNLHAATFLGKFSWIAAGVLAIVSVLLIRRSPAIGAFAALAFLGAYITGAQLIWLQFTPGCWLAIAAFALAALGAYRRET